MHFFKNFYLTNVKYQLLNKFIYQKLIELPKFQKIILNFGSKKIDTKTLFSGLLAFELIVNQKGHIIKAANAVITFQVRKGNPVGCKLILKKDKLFKLFTYLLLNILPKIKQKKLNLNKNAFSYKIKETLTFLKLETHYYFFNCLSNLNLTVLVNTKKKKQILFFYKLLYFF
jgi:large subunit ribosomal protein L5